MFLNNDLIKYNYSAERILCMNILQNVFSTLYKTILQQWLLIILFCTKKGLYSSTKTVYNSILQQGRTVCRTILHKELCVKLCSKNDCVYNYSTVRAVRTTFLQQGLQLKVNPAAWQPGTVQNRWI